MTIEGGPPEKATVYMADGGCEPAFEGDPGIEPTFYKKPMDVVGKPISERDWQDPTQYDSSEQDVLIRVFSDMLWSVTKDGGRKRAAGEKPPWWRDQSHEAAIFSHLNKRKHGELTDPDSGVHPYVHLAWRALAIAYQETYGMRDPITFWGKE